VLECINQAEGRSQCWGVVNTQLKFRGFHKMWGFLDWLRGRWVGRRSLLPRSWSVLRNNMHFLVFVIGALFSVR
jgi:hypothetical protein